MRGEGAPSPIYEGEDSVIAYVLSGPKKKYIVPLPRINEPKKAILVGDLNIAPLPEDVWDHKKMAKIVSHTQVEIDHLAAVQRAGNWVDVTRKDIPAKKLYSWWSYRAKDWDTSDRGRRLDHIWASADIASSTGGSRILREVRGWERPSDHVPVFAIINL